MPWPRRRPKENPGPLCPPSTPSSSAQLVQPREAERPPCQAHAGSCQSPRGTGLPGCQEPAVREAGGFPLHTHPSRGSTSAPHFSKARDTSVICSRLPGHGLYFYSQACGPSLRGCGRGAGCLLHLSIFLLHREGFHFLPELSVLPRIHRHRQSGPGDHLAPSLPGTREINGERAGHRLPPPYLALRDR